MSDFSNFADRPYKIKNEGEEITLTVVFDASGNVVVKWNIPPNLDGCAGTQQAYNGIIIALGTEPADYLTTSPTNGKKYIADPVADPDLFSGDMIGKSQVVGAFYNDILTTTLSITDLNPNIFYYISGYAVDNVGRYHREGVHSYSLPSGAEKTGAPDLIAFQDIGINSAVIVNPTMLTGLLSTQDYELSFRINNPSGEYDQGSNVPNFFGVNKKFEFKGSEVQTFSDLLYALNNNFKFLENPYQNYEPPNRNQYTFYDNILKYWDGFIYTNVNFINSAIDPSLRTVGGYWFNPSNEVLNEYTTSWTITNYITSAKSPISPPCGLIWFNYSNVYEWDGDHWYELNLIQQSFSPLDKPVLTCNTFWYDVTNSLLFNWDESKNGWGVSNAIVSDIDPNAITTGNLWFNNITDKMQKFAGGVWNDVTNIRYDSTTTGTIPNPMANWYWYNPLDQSFQKRDPTNTTWIPILYITYITDPTIRKSNDLWWNQSPSVDALYSWDIINSAWKPVTTFFQTNTDPALPPTLPPSTIWYNTITKILTKIVPSTNSTIPCTPQDTITSLTDPTTPTIGDIWKDLSSEFYKYDGTSYIKLDVISNINDPYNVQSGYIWHDNTRFYIRNNGVWDILPYAIKDITPKKSTQWYNTTTHDLTAWNGGTWVPILSQLIVKLMPPDFYNYRYSNYLRFMTRDAGCGLFVEIIPEANNMLAYLTPSVIYFDPVQSGNGVAAGPMYQQIGVGTDGTSDVRRELHETIRSLLGNPSVEIELTKKQINTAIDNALLQLRKYSNISYKRGMFFIDMLPNQQIYILSNKCVGFNTIVDINAVYRLKSAFFRTGFAGNDLYGFAALQQLYTIGTFDMVGFHLMSSYISLLEDLFSTRIMFQWVENTRELKLYQAITYKERMLMDSVVERTEQDLLTSRDTAIWLQKWALAECKTMLSQVRGKFITLPGPNGSTTLNSNELSTQATMEMDKLQEALLDMAMQDPVDIGMRAHFIQG